MKTNMRDVARHSGVSIATVSHVLNQTRHVSAETTRRVMASVKELGYVPNSLARSFKMGKRNLIGCIIPDISNHFWSMIIDEIETYLAAQGFHLIIANTKEDEQRELDSIALLSSGIVDGLIIASTLTDGQRIRQVLPEGFPVVFIDRTLPDLPFDSDCITISNYESIFQGVTHLIKRGHRNIGYVSDLSRLSTAQERLHAYHDAMAENHLPVSPEMVRESNSAAANAMTPAIKLLRQGCTALVISNNVMAMDILSYLFREYPGDSRRIEVLGYQESSRDIYMMQPAGLISQPSQQMGRIAARQILTRILEPDSEIQKIVLSSTLTLFEAPERC